MPSCPSLGIYVTFWKLHKLCMAMEEGGPLCPPEHWNRVHEACSPELEPLRVRPHCFPAKFDVAIREVAGNFFLNATVFCSLISLQPFSFTFRVPFYPALPRPPPPPPQLPLCGCQTRLALAMGGEVICRLQCRHPLCDFPGRGGC